MKSTAVVDRTIQAWELYSAGNYEDILKRFDPNASAEMRELILLALLETDESRAAVAGKDTGGAFAPLLQAMRAHKAENHKSAAALLGAWLLKKNYFSTLVLRRFLLAAEKSENYSVLQAVARKYIELDNYKDLLVEPLLSSSFFLNQHAQVVQIFETYREHFKDDSVLQKVAFSMMHVGRYKEAERFYLYKKLAGTDYDVRYKEAVARHEALIERIPELEKMTDRSYQDNMDLGMAYMFGGKYKEALTLFRKLRKAA